MGDESLDPVFTGSDEMNRQLGAAPLVSVIMATYDCAHTLPAALESIEQQTYPHWELIVCDDASTDATLQVLARFATQHPGQVTLLRNDSNRRLAFSLNRCLEKAAGPLVARMDADDMSLPERLARQVEFLKGHPEFDVVGTAMQRFGTSGLVDVLRFQPRPDRWGLRRDVPFAHGTVMLRKPVYDVLGGYVVSPRTVRGQDRDLWFRFFAHGFSGANLPDPLYLVREDLAAVRRRTLRVRFNSYRTTLMGFRLLGYPKLWYVRPTLALLKGLVPAQVVLKYRVIKSTRDASPDESGSRNSSGVPGF